MSQFAIVALVRTSRVGLARSESRQPSREDCLRSLVCVAVQHSSVTASTLPRGRAMVSESLCRLDSPDVWNHWYESYVLGLARSVTIKMG